jgi:hypothetical protein
MRDVSYCFRLQAPSLLILYSICRLGYAEYWLVAKQFPLQVIKFFSLFPYFNHPVFIFLINIINFFYLVLPIFP